MTSDGEGRLRGYFLAACLILGGCVDPLSLVSGDPPKLFDLTPKSTFDADLPQIESSLTVEVPTATAGLNTTRIAVKPTPTQFEYYAGAQWVDVVPIMAQSLILESFDNSDVVEILGRNSYGLRADYGLLINIREFQAEYDGNGPPTVEVRFQTRLVKMPRRTTLATVSVNGSASSVSKALPEIVTAFDQAFGSATKDLVDWTVRHIADLEGGPS
ncbi:MAG: ABC-type transport auxiliary lipoprotein family protein [Geminicoccaceae bacterium]